MPAPDCLILAMLLLATTLPAQTTVSSAQLISLKECFRLALEHNFDVQIERLAPVIARSELNLASSAYEPVFSFSATRTFLDQPGTFDPKKTGSDFPYELTTDAAGPGLSGILPSGLSYDARAVAGNVHALTDFSSSPANLFPPTGIRMTNEYYAATEITLRQPLLKNFWTDANRQRIWIKRRDLKISELALQWRIMNTVTAVQRAYYELIFAKELVKVNEQALALAERLLVETRARVRVGDLPLLDEKHAETQHQMTQTELIAARQKATEQQNMLKNLLTDDFEKWVDVDLQPVEVLAVAPVTLGRKERWAAALSNRPDLLEMRLEVEKQGIVVNYQFNQLFPSLDLVGSYGGRGSGADLGIALADVRNAVSPAYSYGVMLTIPLGNGRARSGYRASKAAREQAELNVRKMQQDILVQVDNSEKSVQSAWERTRSAETARRFAEEALSVEEKKLRNGASTGFMVLQVQQKLTDARAAEVRALVDFHVAVAMADLSDGTTLSKNYLSVDFK